MYRYRSLSEDDGGDESGGGRCRRVGESVDPIADRSERVIATTADAVSSGVRGERADDDRRRRCA